MSNQQWGFTPANVPSYPPYLNVTKHDDGSFEITVRSAPKEDGSCGDCASMTMSGDDFKLYVRELASPFFSSITDA